MTTNLDDSQVDIRRKSLSLNLVDRVDQDEDEEEHSHFQSEVRKVMRLRRFYINKKQEEDDI